MKALIPTKKNKFIFTLIFNLLMMSIFYFVTVLTWKVIAALVFSNSLILINWLPKNLEQLDEREQVVYLKLAHTLSVFFGAIITAVLSLHILFFQNMSVIEFVIYIGIPIVLYMSWQSHYLKREFAEN